jgi:hypothetical protein
MNWYLCCAYQPEQKRRFHATARARLRKLAAALDFAPVSYDLRNNEGGIAVSGEITLHHERVYIQVCQPATGPGQRHPDPHMQRPARLHGRAQSLRPAVAA